MFNKKIAKGKTCPLMKGECIEDQCMFWTHIRGQHPQSGADLDLNDCSIRWLPVLLIENAKETRQTAAAVESSRNENMRAVGNLATVVSIAAGQAQQERALLASDNPKLISGGQ